MLGAIFTALSGMTAYAKGLDTISNNVANLNTPGFKKSDPVFADLVYQSRDGAVTGSGGSPNGGAGVQADDDRLSLRQGQFQSTNNPLDVAIDGNGFFVLERDGETLYTRAGQFQFDQNGVLVDTRTGAKVMMSSNNAGPAALDIDDLRVFAARATQQVDLTGTLARASTDPTFTLDTINVVDPSGGLQTLKAVFTRDDADPLTWHLEISDAGANVLGDGSVSFAADGTPAAGANSIPVTLTLPGQAAFTVNFSIGAPGTFAGITSPGSSTTSQVQQLKQDGVQTGSITQFSFSDKGELTLTYSNGETKTAGTLVLARFDTADQIVAQGDSVYIAAPNIRPVLGNATQQGLGNIVGGKVELSNVDLTEQFTDLIIIQRGYQASSQITSTANEMLQQLITMGNNH